MSTSKALQHLYSLGASSPDLSRHLYCLIRNDDEEKYLTGLRGSDLFRLVNFLDEALDTAPITDDVSRRCLHKLQAICRKRRTLPSSYNISGSLSTDGDEPVASGGFSDVWQGIYDERRVCIKRLRTTQQNRRAVEKGFCKEAVMWKRLRHPNIVAFIGVTRDPMQFVSEWMPNGILTRYLNTHPTADRICLLLDVAEGLTFLHANHTTHGDLKGPNVLIDHSGHARLADFGFASVVRELNSTLVTQVEGYTPRWAAPEVLNSGDRCTREADVFAFGMVVVEVFTGRIPFSEFTDAITITKIINGERPDRPRTPDLTDAIWDMTLRCWLQDPTQRPEMTKVVEIFRERRRLHTTNLHSSMLAALLPLGSAYNPGHLVEISYSSTDSESRSTQSSDASDAVNDGPVATQPLDRENPESPVTSWYSDQPGSQPRRPLAVDLHLVKPDDSHDLLSDVGRYSIRFPSAEEASRYADEVFEDVTCTDKEEASCAPAQIGESEAGASTHFVKCYTPFCVEEYPCYAYSCPKRGQCASPFSTPAAEGSPSLPSIYQQARPLDTSTSFPDGEVKRQRIIRKVITNERQYVDDLDFIEEAFICPLRNADPPVIRADVHAFIDEVFGNILDLRKCNRRLLEAISARQQEQGKVIPGIGDIFLDSAAELRSTYSTYICRLAGAERRLRKEKDNEEFRVFLEQRSAHSGKVNKIDLKHWLNRPLEHLHRYPLVFEALRIKTAEGNPDVNFLKETADMMRNIQSVAQLKAFQMAAGKGSVRKFEWHNFVPEDTRNGIPVQLAKRQAMIFELIQEEMCFVRDLENIEHMYIQPLRSAEPPIIPHERLEPFIRDVFRGFSGLYAHHKSLSEQLFEIQIEQYPIIKSVTAPILQAVLNSRDAYLDYIPNVPIAAYRIDDEIAKNPQFKAFVQRCVRHPDAHRSDMRTFTNGPILHLIRYELLLEDILKETPVGHEDLETIPKVLSIIKELAGGAGPGLAKAKRKVELWNYSANLVFEAGGHVDMELFHENRTLVHTGKFLQQPETGSTGQSEGESADRPEAESADRRTELFALLFDNYFVLTITRKENEVTKYHVYRQPIPLDFLDIERFRDDRVDAPSDDKYPCSICHTGRPEDTYSLFLESALARLKWWNKLEEAIGLRKITQATNEVFRVNLLVTKLNESGGPSRKDDRNSTGQITCSVPFTTPDRRALVAIGSENGVWVASRDDPRSIRRALHLHNVTQCAALEDFGIFLVLAKYTLLAYNIDALADSSPGVANASKNLQQLDKNVEHFTICRFGGRALVVYTVEGMVNTTLQVLEPAVQKINREITRTSIFSKFSSRSRRSEWFRPSPSSSGPLNMLAGYDVLSLKGRVAILRSNGFQIFDPENSTSIYFPQGNHVMPEGLKQDSPIGIFTSGKAGFLLCYPKFGLYADNDGYPTSMGTVQWEVRAKKVACHPPYILLFSGQFIEIRHVETSRLVQVIPGENLKCICDGRQGIFGGSGDGGISQWPRVHGVMDYQSNGTGTGTRCVFGLIPKVPLPLAEPFASSSHTS